METAQEQGAGPQTARNRSRIVAWAPQPGPQAEAISATWCNELFYGGARGGGKSDFLLGDYLQDVHNYGSAWAGILIRKSQPELEELVARSHEIYPQTGASFSIQKSWWTWPNGAKLKMRMVERTEDTRKYQGHQYAWIGWDELTNYPDDQAYRQMIATNRSAVRVPTKRIRSSGNPGGVGHGWVKKMFVDPAPSGLVPMRVKKKNGNGLSKRLRMYVPSRVSDNRILTENDPEYINNLYEVGSPELVRCWLEGDWNAITGAYFTEFTRSSHILRPFEVPSHWLRFISFDWGFSAPFSVGWWAVSDGLEAQTADGKTVWIPIGALVRYREWYGATKPNVGLRMDNAEIARGIVQRSGSENISYRVADPAIFAHSGGPSIAETFAKHGVTFQPGDNKDRVGGWSEVRQRLRGVDGMPLLYAFETCPDFARVIPIQQHDPRRLEDLDTRGEDHLPDEVRYGCLSRPWVKHEQVKSSRAPGEYTLDELWAQHDKRSRTRTRKRI